jgi:hypothetical protein
MSHLTVRRKHLLSKQNKNIRFFLANSKWGLATTLLLYVSTAVAVPFFVIRWQLLKKRAG